MHRRCDGRRDSSAYLGRRVEKNPGRACRDGSRLVSQEHGLGCLHLGSPCITTSWRRARYCPGVRLFTGRSTGGLWELFGTGALRSLLQELHLDVSSRDPAASPHCQVLRDLSPTVTPDVAHVLLEVGKCHTKRPEMLTRWREARGIARDAARAAASPEAAGQLAAVEIRHALSLDGQPIDDVPEAVERLGLAYEHTTTVSRHDRMMVAARQDGAPVARTLQAPSTTSFGVDGLRHVVLWDMSCLIRFVRGSRGRVWPIRRNHEAPAIWSLCRRTSST